MRSYLLPKIQFHANFVVAYPVAANAIVLGKKYVTVPTTIYLGASSTHVPTALAELLIAPTARFFAFSLPPHLAASET